MRTIYVSPEFPLNRRMRKDVRRGKLQVVREGGESSLMGGGIPSGKGRAFRTTGSPLVCMADNGAEVSRGTGGGSNEKDGSPKIPPTLYKYAPPCLERIKQVIVDKKVYISSPLGFNDPYDCRVMPDMSTSEKTKEVMQQAEAHNKAGNRNWENVPEEVKRQRRQKFANQASAEKEIAHFPEFYLKQTNLGIYCLCQSNSNAVMWAHYAENHTGVCYEFNMESHEASSPHVAGGRRCFPFTFLRKVRYEDSCPTFDFSGDLESFANIFIVKAKEWGYEQEWRAHMPNLKQIDNHSGEHFFPPDMLEWGFEGGNRFYSMDEGLLSGVILGGCMEDSMKKKIVKMAKAEKIEVKCARPKTFKYGFDIVPYDEAKE